MSYSTSYAILLRDKSRPTADAIRRAFSSFSHLTDADAVRLAANAQGILLRHVGPDEGRALQRALQNEGVSAALVHEQELQVLPPSQGMHRLEFTPEQLVIQDVMGRAREVAWEEIALVAAGAVPHVDVSVTQTSRTDLSLSSMFRSWGRSDVRSRLETSQHLILELVLRSGVGRFELLAHQFPFNYVINLPAASLAEKFVWLVLNLIRQAPNAWLNRGAQDILDGVKLARGYPSRQVMWDEMTWLLWSRAHAAVA